MQLHPTDPRQPVTILLNASVVKEIDSAAEKAGVSRGEAIRQLLALALKGEK
jgi:metal-responsive CopG/Arc/MetJ family transcriptional regulator